MECIMQNFAQQRQATFCMPCNTLSKKPFNVWRMKSRSELEVLADVVQGLLDATGLSINEIARRSNGEISAGTISGIIRRQHMPQVNKIAALAAVFGLRAHHLINPEFNPATMTGAGLDKIYHAYATTNDEGRRVLESQAEYIAKRDGAPANDPNGPAKKKPSAG